MSIIYVFSLWCGDILYYFILMHYTLLLEMPFDTIIHFVGNTRISIQQIFAINLQLGIGYPSINLTVWYKGYQWLLSIWIAISYHISSVNYDYSFFVICIMKIQQLLCRVLKKKLLSSDFIVIFPFSDSLTLYQKYWYGKYIWIPVVKT